MKKEPDLRNLAAHVRKKLKAGEPALFQNKGVEFYITTLPFNRLLIATSAGESAFLEHTDKVSALTFSIKGFRLQRALFLARLIEAYRAVYITRKDGAEHGERQSGDPQLPKARGRCLGYPQKRTRARRSPPRGERE